MNPPRLEFVQCTAPVPHRMAYWEWGDPTAAHTVLCVHGLTRQGRDFDVLAQTLVERAGGQVRVLCPDVVGRGQSDFLADPQGYQLPTYVADMLELLAATLETGHSVALRFSAGRAIRLEIGRLACHLGDVGEPWPTPWKPAHPLE